jgi:hypothetical protein
MERRGFATTAATTARTSEPKPRKKTKSVRDKKPQTNAKAAQKGDEERVSRTVMSAVEL